MSPSLLPRAGAERLCIALIGEITRPRVAAGGNGQQAAARLAAVHGEVAGILALPFVQGASRPRSGRAGVAGMLQ